MRRRGFSCGLGWVVAAWLVSGTVLGQEGRPPNVVLVLADDLGYGDLGCYGAPDAKTPVLDALAAEGVRFTRHYANAPECTPTRTALLTGRYPQRVGGLECAIGVGNVGRYDDAERLAGLGQLGLPAGASVLPSALKDRGYDAVIFGKWHLGYEPEFGPIRHGWDAFFGVIGGNMDYFRHREQSPLPVLFRDEEPVEREGYATHLFADSAVRFLRDQAFGRPFFLYVPLTVPHTPIQPPDDPDREITDANWGRGTRPDYVAMVEDMDRQVGRILEALDERGLSDDTVVVFASDNGGTNLADNGIFRGTKGTLFEGGIRVPCIVRAPGRIGPGAVSDQACVMMDLTASILALAGAEAPADRPAEGIDLLGHVAEGRADVDRTLAWRYRRGDRTWKAIADGPLKYVQMIEGGRADAEEWLFDLEDDPEERRDLIEERPGEADRLRRTLAGWEAEVSPSR